MSDHEARVLAIDAGGTMTDTFIVDGSGSFVVGKAQTTPDDESVGFMESAHDALAQWDSTPAASFGAIASGIYSGTAMLNRLLSRTGRRIGAIVTAGQEDYLRIERGIQTYLGFSYSDRLHLATHFHNEPIVERELVKGVRGRIDVLGAEVLPLREADAREAAAELLDAEVEGICVCLLFGYRNAEHEIRVGEILEEAKRERGIDGQVPVYLASELYPLRRDLPRLNSTLIEAYAAEPSRGAMQSVRDETKRAGAGFELRVMASHGGTISIEARELATTLVSGPIGGVVGGQALARRMGLANVLCTDIGGTSFDIALITDGRFEITPTPDIARFLLNMPLVKIDSIGAGTGSFVRVNPNSNRPELGPDSAGSRIGVSWPEGEVETVSVTDLNVVLGRVNPDYFLGGDITLDPDRARAEVERQVAEPLGLGVEDAAAGVIELFEQTLRNEAIGRILGKGYSPADYALLCYGGGGPLHVGGYTEGVAYRDILIPAWAAGFSAYGCACADFEYRYDQTVDMPILPTADDMEKAGIGFMVTGAWQALEDRVAAEFAKSGRRARPNRLPPLRADAVLRPAQRHRDRLPPDGDGGGRACRRADRRLRAGLLKGVRALGPLARARLPDHPGDRPRRGGGREARPAGAHRDAGGAAGRGDADGALARRRRGDLDRPPRTGSGRSRDSRPGDHRAFGDDLRDPARPHRPAGRPPDLPPERGLSAT